MQNKNPKPFNKGLTILGVYLILGLLSYIYLFYSYYFLEGDTSTGIFIILFFLFQGFVSINYFNKEKRSILLIKILLWIILIPSAISMAFGILGLIGLIASGELAYIFLVIFYLALLGIPLFYLEYIKRHKELIRGIFTN